MTSSSMPMSSVRYNGEAVYRENKDTQMSDTQTNQAEEDLAMLIEHMQRLGWRAYEDGRVGNDELGTSHADWVSAIKACIEIASGY